MINIRFWLPAIGWALFILIISLVPSDSLPEFKWINILAPDKLGHILVYAILTILLNGGLQKQYSQNKSRFKYAIWAFIASIVYGGLIETIQGTFLTDRFFDILDILANIIGCFLGFLVIGK